MLEVPRDQVGQGHEGSLRARGSTSRCGVISGVVFIGCIVVVFRFFVVIRVSSLTRGFEVLTDVAVVFHCATRADVSFSSRLVNCDVARQRLFGCVAGGIRLLGFLCLGFYR